MHAKRQVSNYFTLLMTEASSEAYLCLELSFPVLRRSICETYNFILALRHYAACLKQKNEINFCSPYTQAPKKNELESEIQYFIIIDCVPQSATICRKQVNGKMSENRYQPSEETQRSMYLITA